MKELFACLFFVAAIQFLSAFPGEKNDTNVKLFPNGQLPLKGTETQGAPEIKATDENTDTAKKQNKGLEHKDEAISNGEMEKGEDEEEDDDVDENEILDSKAKDERMDKAIEEEEEEEAELNPDLFEGDLKLSQEEINDLREQATTKKDSVVELTRRWPAGRVPYILDRRFARDKGRMQLLRTAIANFKKSTCVRFVPKKGLDRSYIKFIIGKGCYSTGIGKRKRGGRQTISIGSGCTRLGTVIHEMMHAIGFFHEHTRRDRDQHIRINWENIEKDKESQFMKYNHGEADYLNEPYDYDSVMHYSRTAFGKKTKDGRMVTIVPRRPPWAKIGQRKGFSYIDLRQINKMYNCKKELGRMPL